MGQKLIGYGNLVVYVNARPYGVVNSFEWAEATPSRKNGGIDTPTTIELAPTTSQVSGSMNIWRLRADGGLEGSGLKPHSRKMARARYFSLTLVDRITDEVFFHAPSCRVTNQQWSTRQRSLVQGTVTWEALDFGNELSNE